MSYFLKYHIIKGNSIIKYVKRVNQNQFRVIKNASKMIPESQKRVAETVMATTEATKS